MQGSKCHRKRKTIDKTVTYVAYRCYHNQQVEYKHKCKKGATVSQNLAASVIIPFVADVINNQIGLNEALENAAEKFGKTPVEVGLESSLKAELLEITEKKERIIKAIADGILDNDEASKSLTELRGKEQRLERELTALTQKDETQKEYLDAMKALYGTDIEKTLWMMFDKKPVVLRRLLEMIFKPSSIYIKTKGKSRFRTATLVGYEFTDEFEEFISCAAIYSDRQGPLYSRPARLDALCVDAKSL
jgi:hypothetical protein